MKVIVSQAFTLPFVLLLVCTVWLIGADEVTILGTITRYDLPGAGWLYDASGFPVYVYSGNHRVDGWLLLLAMLVVSNLLFNRQLFAIYELALTKKYKLLQAVLLSISQILPLWLILVSVVLWNWEAWVFIMFLVPLILVRAMTEDWLNRNIRV